MFIVQELQTNGGQIAFVPPAVHETRQEAESDYYIKLGYAAISDVDIHAVIMYTTEGFPIMHGCYKHGIVSAAQPGEEEAT